VLPVTFLKMETTEQFNRYEDVPLLDSMLRHETVRTARLQSEGQNQMQYPKSNDGWIRTMFVVRGRALDLVLLPWFVAVFHSVIYCIIQEVVLERRQRDMKSWEIFFSLVLNTTLSFLLVFRLNRAADRYWSARTLWGILIAKARMFSGVITAHADHDVRNRDEALRWIMAFVIATMEFLRNIKDLPKDNFAGILSHGEVEKLASNSHPPIYALDKARSYVNKIFPVDADTPLPVAQLYTQRSNSLEVQINGMLECCGGLERIRGTPLPMVYVAHLRTFLMLALLFFPYVWGPTWRWATIPAVACTAFAWLGIDAAASEAGSPFSQQRVNSLDMDGYCLGYITVVTQELKNHADEQLQLRKVDFKTK